MAVQDRESVAHAAAQELGHRRFPGAHEAREKAQARDVARELVIVPQQPAQDLAPLVGSGPAEQPETLGEIARITPDWASRRRACSSTGTSPNGLIRRYASVRVSPLKKSTNRGSQSAPHRQSISAAL
jgi:hypothetical protein